MEQDSSDFIFSTLLINLMKGVVYADNNPSHWQHLLQLQGRIRDYFSLLGLELVVIEDEGFAWLRTRKAATDDNQEGSLPRLVARRQLSYPVSLVLALLRRRLVEHDSSSAEKRLILDKDDIVDLVKTFLPSGSNQARIVDQIDSHIRKVIDLGFARRLRTDKTKIEVLRIIKAFIDAYWLEDFDTRLQLYLSPELHLTEEPK